MSIGERTLKRLGGSQLARRYENRMEMLRRCYPELIWPSEITSHLQWKDPALHFKFIKYVEEIYKIEKLEDWRTIETKQFRKLGGSPLLKCYGNIHNMLKVFYGNAVSDDILQVRPRLLPGSRKQDHVQERTFNHLRNLLAFQSMEDWYSLTTKKMDLFGKRFYEILGRPAEFLPKFYPNYPWDAFRFNQPHSFWSSDFGRHVEFMYSLEKYAKVSDPSEFTRFHEYQFYSHNGKRCFRYYHSFLDLLLSIYPYRKYSILSSAPPQFWRDKRNVITFVNSFLSQYTISTKFQLYTVSQGLMSQTPGFNSLLTHYGSWAAVVRHLFPRFTWEDKYFDQSDEKSQNVKYLKSFLRHIFDLNKMELIIDYFIPEIQEEIAAFVPSMKVAFVYHSENDYIGENNQPEKLSFSERFTLDEQKRNYFAEKGIRLIIIPYWATMNLETIRARLISGKAGDLEDKLVSSIHDVSLPVLPQRYRFHESMTFATSGEEDEKIISDLDDDQHF